MIRRKLPQRRPSTLVDLVADDGSRYVLCIGYDEIHRPREIFISGAKTGSHLDALLADAAIAISIGLQHGVDPAAYTKSMSRLNGKVTAASMIGLVADALAAEATHESR